MKAILVRHATSSGQQADAPLAPIGFAQAQAIVPVLKELEAGPLYASSMLRAFQTLEPYATASYQSIKTIDDLRERLLTPVPLENWQDHIKRSFDDPTHHADGGESHEDMLVRWHKALTQIETLGGHLPTFATHGGMTAALFNQCDPSFGFDDWKSLKNPDLFEVTIQNGAITHYSRIEHISEA